MWAADVAATSSTVKEPWGTDLACYKGRMRLLSLLVLGVVTFLPVGEARACSCMMQTLEEGIAQSQAIFEGTVTKIAPTLVNQFPSLEVSLAVRRAWKGIDREDVLVTTASNSAACGYRFAEGSTYLVYAHRDKDGPLRVSLCSLTKPIDEAGADLALLGKPATALAEPTKKSVSSKERCSASGGTHQGRPIALLAWVIAGVALFRRRL